VFGQLECFPLETRPVLFVQARLTGFRAGSPSPVHTGEGLPHANQGVVAMKRVVRARAD